MDPHSPKKLFATKYCFLILGDEFLFLNHFFISRFLFFLFYVILLFLIFTKTVLLLSFFLIFFFMKITFIFSCSGMSRHVPECSGIFHVPDFIDALLIYLKAIYEQKWKKLIFQLLPRNEDVGRFFCLARLKLATEETKYKIWFISEYLTTILRGRVGYEMIDSQRGA